MIVMKFGGSSVSDGPRIRGVIEIVRSRLDRKPVVVASAFRGVTDDLFAAAEEALTGKEGLLEKVRARHQSVIADLGLPADLVHEVLAELAVLLKGISLVKELTPRTLDYVVSFGERLSTRIMAAAFDKAGIPASQHDAFDIGMLTDDQFGHAQPLPEAETELRRHVLPMKRLPIVTGYVGKTRGGDITTLGRNGSDFTATIIGAAIGAEEIQIWSDTDGVMTADPRLVPSAKPIAFLTFDEASELAYYGGKVLHPSTIVPAVLKGIPVKVLNTFRPGHPGTTVLSKLDQPQHGVKSIAHHLSNFVVNIRSSRMLMGHGFLARLFGVFAEHRVVVNMVSTSEVTVSVTVDSPRRLDAAVEALSKFAEVTVEEGRTVVCVVGEGLRSTPGIAGLVFEALREASVNVLMISQGASKINVAFVVADRDAESAVRALHRKFFDDPKG
ncbi:MAG TPA: aspartate kinase [Planctomycetota bacterium]|nr:aspartate kinase [Planctomycetota bacterium]